MCFTLESRTLWRFYSASLPDAIECRVADLCNTIQELLDLELLLT